MGEINYFCDESKIKDEKKSGFMMATIVHEFVHLLYHEKIKGVNSLWLEEGLATYLSGQKSLLQKNFEKYKEWFDSNIKGREVPKVEYLRIQGNKYGEFCDKESNRYNGYDFSYALVRYLIENYGKNYIIEIIQDANKFEALEKTWIADFVLKYKL